jgi:hypothetical protein
LRSLRARFREMFTILPGNHLDLARCAEGKS